MKTLLLTLIVGIAFAASIGIVNAADSPKKLLVVTTTAGYRHASIPVAEKAIARMGEQSGLYTVDFVRQPDGKPTAPTPPKPLTADATDEQKAAFKVADEKFKAAQAAYEIANAPWLEKLKAALAKLSPESLKNYDAVAFISTTGD